MIRRVMRTDAVSLGISSAANMVAIETLARDFPKDTVLLTMIYDGVESYLLHLE